MAYTPPSYNAVDFALDTYTAPGPSSINFDIGGGATGTPVSFVADSACAIANIREGQFDTNVAVVGLVQVEVSFDTSVNVELQLLAAFEETYLYAVDFTAWWVEPNLLISAYIVESWVEIYPSGTMAYWVEQYADLAEMVSYWNEFYIATPELVRSWREPILYADEITTSWGEPYSNQPELLASWAEPYQVADVDLVASWAEPYTLDELNYLLPIWREPYAMTIGGSLYQRIERAN